MNCPNCHKPIPPNARFCGGCGRSVNDRSAASPLPEPPLLTIATMPAAAMAAGGSASLALPGLIERVKNQVEITGDGVDMSSLEQALGQIDLTHLESMKDQGAQPK